MEQILSPANLNAAYLQVKQRRSGRRDRMSCERPLGYLIEHGEETEREYSPKDISSEPRP